MSTVYRKMLQRRDTRAALLAADPVPASGEIVWATNQKRLYVGDGITAGGWPVGDLVNPMTAPGSIIIGGSGGVAEELAVESNDADGFILTLVGGMPAWAANAALMNPMTELGSMIVGGSGGVAEELEPGTEGQFLGMVGGVPTWTNFSGFNNPMTQYGSIIIGGSAGVAEELQVGSNDADGMVLTLVDGAPAWQAAPSGLPDVESDDLEGYVLTLDSDLNPVWSAPTGGEGGGGAGLHIGDSPPGDPEAEPFWWSTEEGVLKIYYDDGDTQQWVDAVPSASGSFEGGTILKNEILAADANIDWTSLPSGYDRWELFINARGNTTGAVLEGMKLTFNNDTTAANYKTVYTQNSGSSTSIGTTADRDICHLVRDGETAGYFTTIKITILQPDSTLFKKNAQCVATSKDWTDIRSMTWNSASALNRLSLAPGTSALFKAGSQFKLVGFR